MPMIVPEGIVAVPRQSPQRVRKRTPLRVHADGAVVTARPGERDWFGDGVFVESRDGHLRSGYSLSLLVHLCAVVPLLAFLMSGTDDLIIIALSPERSMPAFMVPPPVEAKREPATSAALERAVAKVVPVAMTRALPPPPPRAGDVDAVAAPIEAPSGITPEIGKESLVPGVPGGVAGGVAGGVVGGIVGGGGDAVPATGAPGPALPRAGTDIKPPRKTKDVKPIYPAVALPTRAQGAVLIEAVVGPDGKVRNAKVVHSVPLLDQAALDAVSQWEYEPSFLNGVAVAVVMTVVVRFTLQ
jgi:protein TonB